MDINATITARLKAKRWTVSRLAQKLGRDRSNTWHSIHSHNMPLPVFLEIVKALGGTVEIKWDEAVNSKLNLKK